MSFPQLSMPAHYILVWFLNEFGPVLLVALIDKTTGPPIVDGEQCYTYLGTACTKSGTVLVPIPAFLKEHHSFRLTAGIEEWNLMTRWFLNQIPAQYNKLNPETNDHLCCTKQIFALSFLVVNQQLFLEMDCWLERLPQAMSSEVVDGNRWNKTQ